MSTIEPKNIGMGLIVEIMAKPENERTEAEKDAVNNVLQALKKLPDDERAKLVTEARTRVVAEDAPEILAALQLKAEPLLKDRVRLEAEKEEIEMDPTVTDYLTLREGLKAENKRVAEAKTKDAVKTLLDKEAEIKEANAQLKKLQSEIIGLGGTFKRERKNAKSTKSTKNGDEEQKRKRAPKGQGKAATKRREQKEDEPIAKKSATKKQNTSEESGSDQDSVRIGIARK